jgi:DNA modification methylase
VETGDGNLLKGEIFMTDEQKKYLIELLENDMPIPEDMKYVLFPTLKEEYELVYAGKMRKEDLLSNEDGTFPLPLQIDRVFKQSKTDNKIDDWNNLIVFGDNLQFLKTIYENKDPLIKDKIKGKVKLIYIDPPFATQDEFSSKAGAKAYNDKKQGAEFLEFLRRRLILAREILADDGSIYLHLDEKMSHYGRVIMDEVFGKNNFRSAITWDTSIPYVAGFKWLSDNWIYSSANIFYYTKTSQKIFNKEFEKVVQPSGDISEKPIKDIWTDIENFAGFLGAKDYKTGYPTQKPEALLKRIIEASTNPGDIVFDFFGGSGTTMAVAEKLNRKWIMCDLGKLSYFTMQKRLLNIANTNDLVKGGKYGQDPKPFISCKLGMYDLKETLSMEWEKYKNFVSQLFEIKLEKNTINGVEFDGYKSRYPVKIFDYNKYKDTNIDATYLNNLLSSLGRSAPKEIYIISPATRVSFLADYEEIKDTRFYFLNVPYEMILELHKVPFVKFRQPKSRQSINEIEEMKGFQFIDKPQVSCKLIEKNEKIQFIVDEFKSYSIQNGYEESFSTLSSIYVDYDNNGDFFIMDDVKFWDQIISKNKSEQNTWVTMKKNNISSVTWEFKKGDLGENPMFIISDIYGNDFVVKPKKGDK